MEKIIKSISNWLSLQKRNLFLWCPIIASLGMGAYFSISQEQKLWFLISLCTAGIAVGIIFRKHILFVLLACIMFGFGYAGIFTHSKTVPFIGHDMHNIEITGKVYDIDYKEDKTQIYMQTKDFGTIRVSTKSNIDFNIGDTITGTGGLFKPDPAIIPGGFDFARWMYFNNISATGYIDAKSVIKSEHIHIGNFRETIHQKSNSFLTDALILGYKKTLPTAERAVWTANGIAHIWSISGYHVSLITGWLCIIFYLIFRSIPAITRRIPARIPAMICAWLGLILYVILSGGGVAILRAFIMASLALLAIILGRNMVSLRIICIAFGVLILINPHYVVTAGFQLSFSAIFGIVWLWTVAKPRMPENRILKYIYAAFLTTLIATLFTLPFIALHFNSIPLYSLIGNIIFLPIFSFIIMPLVFIGTLLAVFNLHFALNWAETIYTNMLNFATKITELPYSEISTGTFSNPSLVLIIIGFGCLIFIIDSDKFKYAIMRNTNILLASIFTLAGILFFVATPRPIFYISPDHNLIGFVGSDGDVWFSKTKDSNNTFAFDTWRRANGNDINAPRKKLKKDHGVHKIITPKWNLVYMQQFVPLLKNLDDFCNDKSIKWIASYFDITAPKCKKKIINGGGAIYPSGRFYRTPDNRLWHNRPE